MTKTSRWTVALCLGLMMLAGGYSLRAAGLEIDNQWSEVRARMAAEGWTEISKGVFERQLGPTKVEHLSYGREGLAWTIGNLTRQLEHLMQEYEAYPSEELATIIDELSVKIAGAKVELRNTPAGMSVATAALEGASCSSICYSATADAYPLTSTQGVGAVAEAKFNSACGYSGDTYAYAYARATLNGTTTTVTQSDPKTGTNVTSYAAASVNGGSVSGIPCYSEANSYAQSSALGISYTTRDSNTSCPAPNLSVTINGSSWEYFTSYSCRTVTWTSTVSGGTSPYTYQWKYNGTVVGSGSSYSRSVCPFDGGFSLDLTVTDTNSTTASDTHWVDVYYEEPCGSGGQICQ